ncbi:MAG: hypothetical protein E6H92_08670 [Chloroflexi bacterium]|nr:MAG: hypothetical protein E6H92_08670 [Chloroflexota bacterium]
MSEALAGSSTILPRPGQQRIPRIRVATAPRPAELGTRYLALLSALAVIVGLTFKSELLAPSQVWQATAILCVLVTAGLLFLHARNATPGWLSLDHYVSPVLAIVAASGFSLAVAPDWRVHALAMFMMGAVIYTSSYVDLCRGIGRTFPLHRFLRDASTFVSLLALFYLVLQSNLPDILRFSWIFAVALFSGYRSFRLATQKEGIALLAAFLTAGTVAFGAFGMVTYLNNQGSAYIAVVLAFAWYAWQGLTVHTLADSLNWRIVFEYGLFAVICVYLIVLAILTGRAL